jgi:hypothetical protein
MLFLLLLLLQQLPLLPSLTGPVPQLPFCRRGFTRCHGSERLFSSASSPQVTPANVPNSESCVHSLWAPIAACFAQTCVIWLALLQCCKPVGTRSPSIRMAEFHQDLTPPLVSQTGTLRGLLLLQRTRHRRCCDIMVKSQGATTTGSYLILESAPTFQGQQNKDRSMDSERCSVAPFTSNPQVPA